MTHLYALISLTAMLLISAGMLIYFFMKKKRVALFLLLGFWTIFGLIVTWMYFDREKQKPIRLSKKNIVGEYRIDTTFYPGDNASWQYRRYKFFITDQDSIIFVDMKGSGIQEYFRHKISYSTGHPALWSVMGRPGHHVLAGQPTLYRGRKTFYYVFRSYKFGNMFFRKVKNEIR